MRVLLATFLLLPSTTTAAKEQLKPVVPTMWLPSTVDLKSVEMKDVMGCCIETEKKCDNKQQQDQTCSARAGLSTVTIGRMPQFTTDQALDVLATALKAFDGGMGTWTQMSLQERCTAIKAFFQELSKSRDLIVETLMWEIGKNRPDAESEFDRTVQFANSLIETIQSHPEFNGQWQTIGSTKAFVRRSAIGVFLALAPYNYPLNECYATVIPCLLLGNTVVLKIPSVGGLVHLLTMEAFSKTLPPGVINFISGSGRATMPPLMKTGQVDGLAFIGGSKAADELIQAHPHPHRLKVFLQLEANNMALYLPDLFATGNEAALENALDQAIVGSLSYNGQRCTALKLHFVPSDHAETFVEKLVERVNALPVGLQDEKHEGGKYSYVTPLPNQQRISYMQELIDNAIAEGAEVMNDNGGTVLGGSLMVPAVIFPAHPDMRVYNEEQFGPVIPVTTYDMKTNWQDTVISFAQDGEFGQQVSIFGGQGENAELVAELVDQFSAIFGKINLNTQCGRSPDTLPFAGRRSSAMGVMSVTDALREFSIPTVVAYKESDKVNHEALRKTVQAKSNFLQAVE